MRYCSLLLLLALTLLTSTAHAQDGAPLRQVQTIPLPHVAASYPQFLLSSVLGYAEGVKPLYPSYDHPLNTGTAYEQSGR